ncbi:MAG: hypothetical protein AB2L24_23795 [Mangrovibacterium sp.]
MTRLFFFLPEKTGEIFLNFVLYPLFVVFNNYRNHTGFVFINLDLYQQKIVEQDGEQIHPY